MIRALVIGARGQVGSELVGALDGRAEVVAHDQAGFDLADPDVIRARMREIGAQLVVNAAAYTAVDRAESEPDIAAAVNARAPGILGEEARRAGALLVHFSTDYVFDGTKRSPFVEDDATAPLGVYGRTKLEGERAIAASGCAYVILRTSWVYAPRGRNFLLAMLALAAKQREIRVVDDQRGAPTAAAQLARAVVALFGATGARPIEADALGRVMDSPGLYHATARGETTWFGFAQAIFDAWSRRAGASFTVPKVLPIPTSEYPTPARRPAYSVLSNAKLERTFGVRLPEWRQGLDEVLSALPG